MIKSTAFAIDTVKQTQREPHQNFHTDLARWSQNSNRGFCELKWYQNYLETSLYIYTWRGLCAAWSGRVPLNPDCWCPCVRSQWVALGSVASRCEITDQQPPIFYQSFYISCLTHWSFFLIINIKYRVRLASLYDSWILSQVDLIYKLSLINISSMDTNITRR